MSERCCGQREACRVCGSSEWVEAHFTGGAIVCLACWRAIERHKGKARKRQQEHRLGETTPPEGVQR